MLCFLEDPIFGLIADMKAKREAIESLPPGMPDEMMARLLGSYQKAFFRLCETGPDSIVGVKAVTSWLVESADTRKNENWPSVVMLIERVATLLEQISGARAALDQKYRATAGQRASGGLCMRTGSARYDVVVVGPRPRLPPNCKLLAEFADGREAASWFQTQSHLPSLVLVAADVPGLAALAECSSNLHLQLLAYQASSGGDLFGLPA